MSAHVRAPRGLVPHRQPAPLRPRGPRPGRRQTPRRSCDALDASDDVPVRVVAKPVLTEAAAIRRALLDAESDDACVGVIAWMHTFSPAKMWITGLDHLRKPLLHLHTQANQALPWAEIDMDFMNLNQAAHGDREFAAVQTRLGVTRKTVAGHVAGPRGRPPRRRLGAGRRRPRRAVDDEARPASATTCATSRSPRATRSRPSGASASRSTPGASTTSSRSWTRSPTPTSTRWSPSTPTPTTSQAELLPGRRPARVAALRRPDRARAAVVPRPTAASRRSRRTSRTSAGCASCPGLAVQRLMADGYGFGGEGDWKTSVHAPHPQGGGRRAARRHVVHGGLHLPPGSRRGEDPRRAHARGLPLHRGGQADGRDPPARHRWPRGPGPSGLRRGPRRRRGPRHRGPRRTLPLRLQRGHGRPPRPAAPQSPGRPSSLATGTGPPYVHGGLVDGRRTSPHGPLDRAHDRAPGRPGGDDRDRAGPHRRRHHRPLPHPAELRWNQAYYRLAARACDGPGSGTTVTLGCGTDPCCPHASESERTVR